MVTISKCKFSFLIIFTFLFYVIVIFPAYSQAVEGSSRVIIAFDDNLSIENKKNLIKKYDILKVKDLPLINGTVGYMSEKIKKNLLKEHGIIRIEDDILFTVLGKPASTSTPQPLQPDQTIPWSIKQINADMVWTTTSADTIKVAVIDSGIDLTHPDLKNNIKGGYNAINPKSSYNDDYGHGTHVSGIIAATNNNIGVVGVGPQIDLYAIKVLNSQGNGYLSDIIEGLDWSIKNGMKVINMSFAIPYSELLHGAVKKVNQANIVQIASAGNNYGGAVSYPASYEEVISVSATTIDNQIAPISANGKVDLCAPGLNIYSTYIGSSYTSMNGTSMAAPHVTGTAALLMSVPSKCDLNGDGIITPAEVKQRLEATATDLGSTGKDNIFGSGLVDAYNAVIN